MSNEQAEQESQALSIAGTGMSLSGLAQVFVQSGFFKDVRQQSQAIVKVLLGQELGLKPIQSMMGIHIVEGKPEIGAALMAALVKRSGRYDYEVTHHTDAGCEIAFFAIKEGKREAIGSSGFTMEDAKRAGLAGRQNWQHYPRNMCFARALSNGVKWYCGDAIGGLPIYAEQELSDALAVNGQRPTIDKQTGEVLDPEPEANEYAPRRKEPDSKPPASGATTTATRDGKGPGPDTSATSVGNVPVAGSTPNTPQEAERGRDAPAQTPPKAETGAAPGAPPRTRGKGSKPVAAPSVTAAAPQSAPEDVPAIQCRWMMGNVQCRLLGHHAKHEYEHDGKVWCGADGEQGTWQAGEPKKPRAVPEDHPLCNKEWQGFACEKPAGHKQPHEFTRGLDAAPASPDVGKSATEGKGESQAREAPASAGSNPASGPTSQEPEWIEFMLAGSLRRTRGITLEQMVESYQLTTALTKQKGPGTGRKELAALLGCDPSDKEKCHRNNLTKAQAELWLKQLYAYLPERGKP